MIENLGIIQQLSKFCGSFGANNTLDLCHANLIPQRFASQFDHIEKEMPLKLPLLYTAKERSTLLSIAKATTTNGLLELANKLPLIDCSASSKYIKIALNRMIMLWSSNLLLRRGHGESWYQTNVYSDLYDSLFLTNSKLYLTKS